MSKWQHYELVVLMLYFNWTRTSKWKWFVIKAIHIYKVSRNFETPYPYLRHGPYVHLPFLPSSPNSKPFLGPSSQTPLLVLFINSLLLFFPFRKFILLNLTSLEFHDRTIISNTTLSLFVPHSFHIRLFLILKSLLQPSSICTVWSTKWRQFFMSLAVGKRWSLGP